MTRLESVREGDEKELSGRLNDLPTRKACRRLFGLERCRPSQFCTEVFRHFKQGLCIWITPPAACVRYKLCRTDVLYSLKKKKNIYTHTKEAGCYSAEGLKRGYLRIPAVLKPLAYITSGGFLIVGAPKQNKHQQTPFPTHRKPELAARI